MACQRDANKTPRPYCPYRANNQVEPVALFERVLGRRGARVAGSKADTAEVLFLDLCNACLFARHHDKLARGLNRLKHNAVGVRL